VTPLTDTLARRAEKAAITVLVTCGWQNPSTLGKADTQPYRAEGTTWGEHCLW